MKYEISKIKERIDNAVSKIEAVNPDNIVQVEIEDLNINELSIKLIKQYDIHLYHSPYVTSDIDELIQKIAKAVTVNEFVKYLKEYADKIGGWAEREKDVAFEQATFDMPDGELFAVSYEYWHGCRMMAGHSFIAGTVYYTDTDDEEAFRKALQEEEISYDEILTREELEEKLFEDFIYTAQLGGGNWRTPLINDYEYIPC